MCQIIKYSVSEVFNIIDISSRVVSIQVTTTVLVKILCHCYGDKVETAQRPRVWKWIRLFLLEANNVVVCWGNVICLRKRWGWHKGYYSDYSLQLLLPEADRKLFKVTLILLTKRKLKILEFAMRYRCGESSPVNPRPSVSERITAAHHVLSLQLTIIISALKSLVSEHLFYKFSISHNRHTTISSETMMILPPSYMHIPLVSTFSFITLSKL